MKTIFITVLSSLPFLGFAQSKTDSTNRLNEVYCIIEVNHKGFGSHYDMELDFGKDRSFYKTEDIDSEAAKVKSCSLPVDALNYMAHNGWTLVSSTIYGGNFSFVLRKRL